MFLHGAEKFICFDEEEMDSEIIEQGGYGLKNKSVSTKVYLYACEGAKIFDFESPYESVHVSVARSIAKLCTPAEVIATEDEVDYFRFQVYKPDTSGLPGNVIDLPITIANTFVINFMNYDNIYMPYTHHRNGTWLSVSYDKATDSYITNNIGKDWHE